MQGGGWQSLHQHPPMVMRPPQNTKCVPVLMPRRRGSCCSPSYGSAIGPRQSGTAADAAAADALGWSAGSAPTASPPCAGSGLGQLALRRVGSPLGDGRGPALQSASDESDVGSDRTLLASRGATGWVRWAAASKAGEEASPQGGARRAAVAPGCLWIDGSRRSDSRWKVQAHTC